MLAFCDRVQLLGNEPKEVTVVVAALAPQSEPWALTPDASVTNRTLTLEERIQEFARFVETHEDSAEHIRRHAHALAATDVQQLSGMSAQQRARVRKVVSTGAIMMSTEEQEKRGCWLTQAQAIVGRH